MSQFGYSRKCRVGQCYVMCRSTFSLYFFIRPSCGQGDLRFDIVAGISSAWRGLLVDESHMVLTDALVDGLGSRVARSRASIRLFGSVVDGVPVGSSPAWPPGDDMSVEWGVGGARRLAARESGRGWPERFRHCMWLFRGRSTTLKRGDTDFEIRSGGPLYTNGTVDVLAPWCIF